LELVAGFIYVNHFLSAQSLVRGKQKTGLKASPKISKNSKFG
jgi:hypothetical protein